MHRIIPVLVIVLTLLSPYYAWAQPTSIERLERDIESLQKEIQTTVKRRSNRAQSSFIPSLTTVLDPFSTKMKVDSDGRLSAPKDKNTHIRISREAAANIAAAGASEIELFSVRLSIIYIDALGHLSEVSATMHVRPERPSLTVIRAGAPKMRPPLPAPQQQRSFLKDIAQEFVARLIESPSDLKLMSAERVEQLMPHDIAQIFKGQIDRNGEFKNIVHLMEKPGNVGIYSTLTQPTYLVRSHTGQLLGIMKGRFTTHSMMLTTKLTRFLPLSALRTGGPLTPRIAAKPWGSHPPAHSQPTQQTAPSLSKHPPILALSEWLWPIQEGILATMADSSIPSRLGDFEFSMPAQLPGRLRSLGTEHLDVAALVGILLFRENGQTIYQTVFAVNVAPSPRGSSLIGLKNYSTPTPSTESSGQDLESMGNSLTEVKAAFKQWINAIRIQGRAAVPTLDPKLFAAWLPVSQRVTQTARMKQAQTQIGGFIDHVISGKYDAIHLKLQRLSLLARDEKKRALGFVNLDITMTKKSGLSIRAVGIEPHSTTK